MAAPRTPPVADDLLTALADALDATSSPAEALPVIARAGPAAARFARSIEEALAKGRLAAALVEARLIGRDEAAVVATAEQAARVPAALRWAVARARLRRERRRAMAQVAIGPLALAALMLLTEALPQLVLGTGSLWPSIRAVALLALVSAGALYGIPSLYARTKLRSFVARLPLAGALARLDEEATAAALIAAFADGGELGLAPRAAGSLLPKSAADALAVAAANPFAAVTAFSESFALALTVGAQARDLPARLEAFHRRCAETLTRRLRTLARAFAFAVVLVVTLHGVLQLLSTSLPGLNGDLGSFGSSPEMRELQRELDNAGH